VPTEYARLQRELLTPRLRLTELAVDDAPYLRAIWAERPGWQDVAPERATSILAGRVAGHQETGIHCYAMRLAGQDEVFGYCGLITGRTGLDEPEIAYELLPRMHNAGYATEAVRAVLPAARATGRRRLWSTVRAWNVPSLRVLEKNGFVRDSSRFDEDGELIYLTYGLDGS
jgi:RimJ/RimL family protein N-acetyltransferase